MIKYAVKYLKNTIVPLKGIKEEIKDLEELLEKAMQNSDLMQVNRLSARLRQLKGANNGR